MKAIKLSAAYTILTLLYFGPAKAQYDLADYDHYAVNSGLPTQTTYNLLQDKNGFLWIATDAGVSRFDGKEFVNYTIEDGLGDNEVLSAYEDKRGRIWFEPFSGKQSFYQQGKFHTEANSLLLKKLAVYGVIINIVETSAKDIYALVKNKPQMVVKIDTNDNITLYNLNSIIKDRNDGLSVLYRSGDGCNIYGITGRDRMICVTLPEPKEVKIPEKAFKDEGVKAWFQNSENPENILYKNAGAIYTFNDKGFRLLIPKNRIPFPSDSYHIVFMDRNKNIWVSNHIYNTFFFRYINNSYEPCVPVLKSVFSIVALDKEDNVWFCTANKGLYKIPYKRLLDDVVSGFKNKLLQKNILCTHLDAEGNLWIGYSNGFITQINGSIVKHFNINFGSRTYNRVLQIQSDPKGNIWCATDESAAFLKKLSNQRFASPQSLKENGKPLYASAKGVVFDKQGNTYIVLPGRIIRVSKELTADGVWRTGGGEINQRVYSSFFDSHNRWYVSTIEGLELIENGKTKKLSVSEPILKARIQYFAEDNKGTIFLATYSDGLLALKNNKVVARLTRAEGLPGVICRRVYIIKDTIYIITNGGIAMAAFGDNKFIIIQNISLLDGLHSVDVNDITFLNNTLYAATSEGLSILNLPIEKQHLVQPPVLSIIGFKVNETDFTIDSAISFPYKGQRVRINYIAPVMSKTEAVQYRYRFMGKNAEWHITSSNQLEFNDLQNDNYILEIQAKKYNSEWGASKRILFTITPPFYLTVWFRILIVLMAGISLYFFIKYRLTKQFRTQLAELRQKQAIENERNRIAADIHDDIGSELTNIVILSRIIKQNTRQEEPIVEMVNKIEKSSNELINKINEVIWTLNAANDSLHNLAAYLRNYITNLLEELGLKGTVTIDDSTFIECHIKTELSRNIFLIIKEILHNIVKHSGATYIEVLFTLNKNNTLFLEIKDNGIGFDTSIIRKGNGVKNIKKRAMAMGGSVETISSPGAGCTVRIKTNI